MYSWPNNWSGEDRDIFFYFSKAILATAHWKAPAFWWDGTLSVPNKQTELMIVVCKGQGYGRHSVTQHQLRILYQMFLSSKALSISHSMDRASCLLSLSSYLSLRQRSLSYVILEAHYSPEFPFHIQKNYLGKVLSLNVYLK